MASRLVAPSTAAAIPLVLCSAVLLWAGTASAGTTHARPQVGRGPLPFETANAFVWNDAVMVVQRDGGLWQHRSGNGWQRVLQDHSWRYADAAGDRLWLIDNASVIWSFDSLGGTPTRIETPPGAVPVALAPGDAGIFVQVAAASPDVLELWWLSAEGSVTEGPITVDMTLTEAERRAFRDAYRVERGLANEVLLVAGDRAMTAVCKFRDLMLRCRRDRCTEVPWTSPRALLGAKEAELRAKFGDAGRVPALRVWDVTPGPDGGVVVLLAITDVDPRDGRLSQRDRVVWLSPEGAEMKSFSLATRGAAVAASGDRVVVLNEEGGLDWLDLGRADANAGD